MTGRLSVRAVVEAVSDVTGVATADIIGPHRHRDLVRARQLAMWCAHRYCPHLSYPQIGRRFGARDHTTIMHGVNKVAAEIEAQGKDPVLTAIELVLTPAAEALDLLQIQAADPDPMEIAERAMTEHGVARVTYDEIRAMARFVQAAIVGGRLIVDPLDPEPPEPTATAAELRTSPALMVSIHDAIVASRELDEARFGSGEKTATERLLGAMKNLRTAFTDLGYSVAERPAAFKRYSNAPRKEADHV